VRNGGNIATNACRKGEPTQLVAACGCDESVMHSGDVSRGCVDGNGTRYGSRAACKQSGVVRWMCAHGGGGGCGAGGGAGRARAATTSGARGAHRRGGAQLCALCMGVARGCQRRRLTRGCRRPWRQRQRWWRRSHQGRAIGFCGPRICGCSASRSDDGHRRGRHGQVGEACVDRRPSLRAFGRAVGGLCCGWERGRAALRRDDEHCPLISVCTTRYLARLYRYVSKCTEM
jgi:hypothetical protein